MSHLSEQRTKIKTVHEEILRDSLAMVEAQTAGIQIRTDSATIESYEHEKVHVDCSIKTPNIPRGLGLVYKKEGSGLTFVGDGYGTGGNYEALQQLILKCYQSVAVEKALQFMSYSTNRHTIARLEAVKA
jgi:hypothetical protein